MASIVVLAPPTLLTESLGQVEVTVIRLESGLPPEEGPGAFRHLVALPDGAQARVISAEIFRPGQRLLVSRFRSRLTGRVTLGSPYRLLGPGT